MTGDIDMSSSAIYNLAPFSQRIITTSTKRPIITMPLTVATEQSTNDSNKGISGFILNSGSVTMVVPTVPSYDLTVSCVYILRDEDI